MRRATVLSCRLSVFREIPEASWVAANDLAFAFRDRFPVSRGHTLVVTRRVTPDWFSASADERTAILALVEAVKKQLDEEFHPDGYNVGFNAGEAAGQTVMHLHVHVIPRFKGDMDDPRGGVRHVIPSRGNYLREVAPLATGGQDDPFARHVLPLFDRADDIAIVAAFVQASGLGRIREATELALRRGAQIRIVTGDYLNITQADALATLLDWEHASESDDDEAKGRLEARVIEVEKLAPRASSFHPKSWRFEAKNFGIAFVGSSNLSRSALDTGIEWNLRVERDRDASAYTRIRESFESLWGVRASSIQIGSRPTHGARRTQVPLPPGEAEAEPVELPPAPHDVQLEALARLRAARQQNRRRAIVVLATGLGKTWLAAFDFAQLREEIGRRPRVLFIAHRSELLKQAARTYRRQLRGLGETARVGWFFGKTNELAADLVFASVAKLARSENLARLKAEHFDYVVIDEVHHAAADSYRRLLDHVGDPHFVLGLTATPDRADAADIMGLFDDFEAYRAGIAEGIKLERLTPFHYFGVKDEIDYDNIPWRNRKFDADRLAEAAQTEARMQTLWRAWNEHGGTRTLIFCCSVAHAVFVRSWLRARDVRVAAVFAAEGSDDRETALEQLERGELDAVCAVDVFNEGVDVPSIDRVVMLRPTESPRGMLLGRTSRRPSRPRPCCTRCVRTMARSSMRRSESSALATHGPSSSSPVVAREVVQPNATPTTPRASSSSFVDLAMPAWMSAISSSNHGRPIGWRLAIGDSILASRIQFASSTRTHCAARSVQRRPRWGEQRVRAGLETERSESGCSSEQRCRLPSSRGCCRLVPRTNRNGCGSSAASET